MTLTTSHETGARRLEDALIFSTHDRDWWKGVAVQQYEFASDFSAGRLAYDDRHVISHLSTGNSRLIQKRDGKIHEGRTFVGMSMITPRGYDAAYEGEAVSSTCLQVPHEMVSKAAEEIGRRTSARCEIKNVFLTSDATIGHLTSLFLNELNLPAHPAQRLFTDALSVALATHLLRNYNAHNIQERLAKGLGPHYLAKVITYIEDNTDTAIRLDELAAIAGVSRFHFSRLFKLSTGKSPMDYVAWSRIRKSYDLILLGKNTLAEIALMSGFADQSHFTRQFQLYTGCTPAVYARNKGVRLFRTSQ